MTERERGESLQNPLIHEGAPPDGDDGNEGADEKAIVVDQEGEPVTE